MTISRRSMIASTLGISSSIFFAGCIGGSKPKVKEICDGNCEYIDSVSLDSADGFGGYTDIIIQFTEQLKSIELTVEIQGEEQIVAIRSLNEQNSSGVTVEFNNHKTSSLSDVDLTIHEVETET